MTKLMTVLTAGALALATSCAVFADEPPKGQSQEQQDKDYIAALKKCDALAGAQKQQCVDDVNKKFGRM